MSKKGIKQTKPIDAKYFEYYKSLYLKEGAPSAFFCWQVTLGYAKKHEDFDASNFPSYKTFDRHLKKEIPKQAIYLARYGQAAWNKKYATYIPRDYLKIKAGSCWVSDHAQIDVAVDFNGTTYFPWVFDAQTQEFLGKANTFSPISFLAKTNVEKAIYKKALAIKKKEQKILKSFINTKYQTSNVEIVKNLVKSLDEKDFNSKVKVSKITNTSMDKIVQNERKEKTHKTSILETSCATPIKQQRRLFLTESEKRRREEEQARQTKLVKNA